MKRIVVALGGNAIIKKGETGDIKNQFTNTMSSLDGIVKILKEGNEVVITHGNGPIVGNILIRVAEGEKKGIPNMPLDICVADSQGGIGYMLQQTLQNRFKKEGINKPVFTIISQTQVDKNDPRIKNPTKPVGPFYTKEDLEKIKIENPNWIIREDSGRGFRRVVPSPFPIKIIEQESIKKMVETGFLVITCGGGGIPVYFDDKGDLTGIEAVVDKDFASYVLAKEINADTLIIITNEDNVYLNYNKPNQKKLNKVTLEEIKLYLKEGHFPSGSMGPKIKAAIKFIEDTGGSVLITSIDKFVDALNGNNGTWIQ